MGRPKSREETPNVGCDDRGRAATATRLDMECFAIVSKRTEAPDC